MEYPVFPDEVKVAIDFLEAHPKVIAFSPVTIAGNLKGFVFPERWITVQATGGSDENPHRVAAPRVDVNVYAEEETVAKRLALAACSAMKSMQNLVTSEGVVIRVQTSTPADLTDPVNASPRFVFDSTIFIRPA